MSGACITMPGPFQHLKANTDRAIERGVKTAVAVKSLQRTIAGVLFLKTVPILYSISRYMDKGIAAFNSPAADGLGAEDLRKLGHEVGQIIGRLRRLVKIYDSSGLRKAFLYRRILDKIEDRTEHLSSIVEGIHLSLDSSFGETIALAAAELRSATDKAEPRVLVGRM